MHPMLSPPTDPATDARQVRRPARHTVKMVAWIALSWSGPGILVEALDQLGMRPADAIMLTAWFAIGVAGTVMAALAYQKTAPSIAPWSCKQCGYDLRTHGTDHAICPECGAGRGSQHGTA